MMHTRLLSPVFMLAALLAGGVAAAQPSQIATHPANLTRYANDGATLGFVATAVTALGECAQPLDYYELSRNAVQILEITCDAGDESRFARLTFIRLSAPGKRVSYRPFRMEFLP